MRRFILIFISSCAALFATAQEEIILDSISKKQSEIKEWKPVMEKPLIFDEADLPVEINSLDFSIFHLPLLPDYNKNLDFKKYLDHTKVTSSNYYFTDSFSNLVFPFGHTFNQSSYQLNNRFTFGGSSFGAQSVFDRPKLNSTIQDMSIKGASMFLQYKVSDHFKVETRVSISNHPTSPFEP